MKPFIKHALGTAVAIGVVAAVGSALFVRSGAYNFSADSPHLAFTTYLLTSLRERSIEAGAAGVKPPNLADSGKVIMGAGNYSAMCTGCHLAPGVQNTELHLGLYPQPPDLTKSKLSPARSFYVIKHGIKASGMPAWGKSMEDEDVWSVVAFLQVLPTLGPLAYSDMVSQSGGHSHGGEHGAMGPEGMPGQAIQHTGEPDGPSPGKGEAAAQTPSHK